MKDLYQPVFWCGFALSLSALYASAEKIASGPESTVPEPVLMQISIGEPVQSEIDLGPQEAVPEIGEELQISSPPHGEMTPPLPNKTSAFYEAAKAAMQSP